LKEWAQKDLPAIELKANLVEIESMNIANFPDWFANSTKKTDDIDARLYDSASGDSVISVLQTIRDTKLDISLSTLRDDLRGTGNKTLTDLDSQLGNVNTKLDTLDGRLYDSNSGDTAISVLQTIRDNVAKESTLSSILSKLDIALSTLRDDLRGTGNKTLTDLDTRLGNIDERLYDSASGDTAISVLQTIRDRTPSLTSAGNTPICVRERYVAWDSETLDSPSASTSYEFPSSGSWNVEGYTDIVVYVIADQPCDVKVRGSVDGTNFYDIPGVSLSSGEFVANALNHLAFSLVLKAIKVVVTTGTTAPTSITVYVGKRI